MQDELFKTRYSKYGYGIDVRRTYKDLPCQPFWTWVTGKSLNDRPPRRPRKTPCSSPGSSTCTSAGATRCSSSR